VTSTLVFGDNVLKILLLVDGPDLMLTVPVVRSVPVEDPDEDEDDEPDADSRSDLMKPFVPLCRTLDQPFD